MSVNITKSITNKEREPIIGINGEIYTPQKEGEFLTDKVNFIAIDTLMKEGIHPFTCSDGLKFINFKNNSLKNVLLLPKSIVGKFFQVGSKSIDDNKKTGDVNKDLFIKRSKVVDNLRNKLLNKNWNKEPVIFMQDFKDENFVKKENPLKKSGTHSNTIVPDEKNEGTKKTNQKSMKKNASYLYLYNKEINVLEEIKDIKGGAQGLVFRGKSVHEVACKVSSWAEKNMGEKVKAVFDLKSEEMILDYLSDKGLNIQEPFYSSFEIPCLNSYFKKSYTSMGILDFLEEDIFKQTVLDEKEVIEIYKSSNIKSPFNKKCSFSKLNSVYKHLESVLKEKKLDFKITTTKVFDMMFSIKIKTSTKVKNFINNDKKTENSLFKNVRLRLANVSLNWNSAGVISAKFKKKKFILCKNKDIKGELSISSNTFDTKGFEILFENIESIILIARKLASPKPIDGIMAVLDAFLKSSQQGLKLENEHLRKLSEAIFDKMYEQKKLGKMFMVGKLYRGDICDFRTNEKPKEISDCTSSQKAQICNSLITTLEKMHGLDVYHGDIKLDNFLYSREDVKSEPKVVFADFGGSICLNLDVHKKFDLSSTFTDEKSEISNVDLLTDEKAECLSLEKHGNGFRTHTNNSDLISKAMHQYPYKNEPYKFRALCVLHDLVGLEVVVKSLVQGLDKNSSVYIKCKNMSENMDIFIKKICEKLAEKKESVNDDKNATRIDELLSILIALDKVDENAIIGSDKKADKEKAIDTDKMNVFKSFLKDLYSFIWKE